MVKAEGSITWALRQSVLNCFCAMLLWTEQIKECSICLLHLQTIRKQDATATLLEVKIRIQNNPNKSDQANKKRCNSIQEGAAASVPWLWTRRGLSVGTGRAAGLSLLNGVTLFPSRACVEMDAQGPVPSIMEEFKRIVSLLFPWDLWHSTVVVNATSLKQAWRFAAPGWQRDSWKPQRSCGGELELWVNSERSLLTNLLWLPIFSVLLSCWV